MIMEIIFALISALVLLEVFIFIRGLFLKILKFDSVGSLIFIAVTLQIIATIKIYTML